MTSLLYYLHDYLGNHHARYVTVSVLSLLWHDVFSGSMSGLERDLAGREIFTVSINQGRVITYKDIFSDLLLAKGITYTDIVICQWSITKTHFCIYSSILNSQPVLRIRIQDPVLFLAPGSGTGFFPDPGFQTYFSKVIVAPFCVKIR